MYVFSGLIQENLTELRSFLGAINSYCHFLPNASTLLKPLYALLKKDTKWQWLHAKIH